jgi:hypothetical protein
MAIALAPATQVAIVGETLTQSTSKKVVRHRCPRCFSPVAAVLGGRTVALPLGIFSFPGGAPESWRPQHHMYYDYRVLDVADDLPKVAGSARGDPWAGGAPIPAENSDGAEGESAAHADP